MVPKPLIKKVLFSDECPLLEKWNGSNSPIFFDFGDEHALWWLLPRTPDGNRNHIVLFSRAAFIELQRRGTGEMVEDFEKFLREFSGLVTPRTPQPVRAPKIIQNQVVYRPMQRHFRF